MMNEEKISPFISSINAVKCKWGYRYFHTAIDRYGSTQTLPSSNTTSHGKQYFYKLPYLSLSLYGILKYGDFHEKFNFLKIQDLRPLNTCQKHFEMILPNFPLAECEI